MKKIFYVSFLTLYILIACTKQSSIGPTPIDTLDSLPQIDSFITNTSYFDEPSCNSLLSWQNAYKLYYDSIGRIKTIVRSIPGYNPEPFCSYTLTYNIDNTINKVISKAIYPGSQTGDSIIFIYNTLTDFDIYKYITIDYGSTVYKIYRFNFKDSLNNLNIKLWEAYPYSTYTQTFEAKLIRNNTDEIISSYYFRFANNSKDTLTILNNDFYTNLKNPYYNLYKRLKVPLFYILANGGLSSGNHPFDLSEFYSPHCIKKTRGTIFRCNSYIPNRYAYEREFPEYLFTMSNNNVIRVRSEIPFILTATGGINLDAEILYH